MEFGTGLALVSLMIPNGVPAIWSRWVTLKWRELLIGGIIGLPLTSMLAIQGVID